MSLCSVMIMLIIGIFTGLVTGLTGASGVMVVVPLTTMLLHFSIHDAIGTSLMVDVIAPLAIAYVYKKHGNIDMKSGIWIAIGSMLGAQAGASLASQVSGIGLSSAFGIFLIIMGVLIWKKGLNTASMVKMSKGRVKFATPTQRILTALILGVGIGLMTGVLGAGGGGMILLALIFILRFPMHLAIGTSALIMAITAASGAVGYALHGSIQPVAGLVLGVSAAGSGIVSAKFANRVNEETLGKAIGVIFIILGVVMTILNYYPKLM